MLPFLRLTWLTYSAVAFRVLISGTMPELVPFTPAIYEAFALMADRLQPIPPLCFEMSRS